MNKVKYGLSALCGSLAALTSANAGEMTVKGNANMTWVALDSGKNSTGSTTGNPLGMKTNLTFAGSGELDGGQTFSVDIVHNDKAAWSSANITLNTNALGKFVVSSAEGGQGIGGYDDKMPNAFEEVWDAGVATGVDLAKGVGSSMNFSWTSPSFGGGSNIQIAYAPRNGGKQVNDKSGSGDEKSAKGRAGDVVIDINPDKVAYLPNIFVGASKTDKYSPKTTCTFPCGHNNPSTHQFEANAGVIWTIGPVSAGYQRSGEYLGLKGAAETDYYVGTSWGVSLNVNDDLSLSYGYWDSRRSFHAPRSNEAVKMEGTSKQIAYTIGGLSIKVAETDVDNAVYNTANDNSGTLVQLSMAF